MCESPWAAGPWTSSSSSSLACGSVALRRGRAIPAARIWGFADEQISNHGRSVLMNTPGQAWIDAEVATARAALGDDAAFDRAWDDGRVMNLDRAIEDALIAMAASEGDDGSP